MTINSKLKHSPVGEVSNSDRSTSELEAQKLDQPNWDRMGQIADRLLSTPPDRQAAGKALAPKQHQGRVNRDG